MQARYEATEKGLHNELGHSRDTRARLLYELDALERALRAARGVAEEIPVHTAPAVQPPPAAHELTGTFTVPNTPKQWRWPWKK